MKFFVTYQMPHTGLDEWMKMPEEERKAQEKQMESDWNTWMNAHKDSVTESAGVGKPKRITSAGVEDARNDLMMYSFVEAESLEAAAELFKDHPHFGIPGSWIEVMSVNKNVG
ncbi:MAG: Glutamine synthetase [Parcubacteria bacterium C7867-007]|nr:MAG: Glutamine synthetase [Parcubacteria bacterium C7867-007]